MPFNFNTGTYTPPSGATSATPGQIIQSAVWNTIHSDLSTALTACVTRQGNDNAETTIATASTVDLSTAFSVRVNVSGAGTITSFGSAAGDANLWKIVRFTTTGVVITYNSTSLILPGAASITTQAGDEAIFTCDGSGNWRCVSYLPANGLSIVTEQDFRNLINRNGSFDIWQRGAGNSAAIPVAASTTAYTADGWYLTTGANEACTVSAVSALVNGSLLAAQVQRNSGQTGTAAIVFGFPMDTDEVYAARGKPISKSFVAATGANWSPTSGNLVCQVIYGTGNPVKQVAGYTGQTVVLASTVAIAAGTSATRFQLETTLTVPNNVTQGEVQFSWSPTGTAGTNDWIQFDDVQLEPYIVPSAYDRIPFDVCLQRCKVHYRKTFQYSVAPAQGAGTVGALAAIAPIASSAAQALWNFDTRMRASPSVTTFSPVSANANWRNITGSADVAQTVDNNTISPDRVFISSATVATAASLLAIQAAADSGI